MAISLYNTVKICIIFIKYKNKFDYLQFTPPHYNWLYTINIIGVLL